jgi:hypothetical protein
MVKNNFGIIFWTHLILIIAAYLSPILFRWELISIGVLYLIIQQIIWRGCVLTIAQFGKDPYNTFYYKYLTLLGFKPDKKKLKFITPLPISLADGWGFFFFIPSINFQSPTTTGYKVHPPPPFRLPPPKGDKKSNPPLQNTVLLRHLRCHLPQPTLVSGRGFFLFHTIYFLFQNTSTAGD